MSDSQKTSWHLWTVGIFSLLWSALGCFDYLMTQTKNDAYMSNFTPEQLEYFYGFPSWMDAFWAIGVWGGVLGAILLLIKKKLAVPVFLASLLASVAATIYSYGFSNGLEVVGDTFSLVFTFVILLLGFLFFWYARAMAKSGVLK